ncbi:hypothetical protein PBY51_010223 [Eleginops maclovinus]|uniref:Uncharacterized protein n=1 Tax=Eleginops maclovinus TaxID=56733 RepID=A0AAN7XC76_ELEMC|nr:hypothetical protein PBY51_010223 [Eleginops maclovinus]
MTHRATAASLSLKPDDHDPIYASRAARGQSDVKREWKWKETKMTLEELPVDGEASASQASLNRVQDRLFCGLKGQSRHHSVYHNT